MDLSVLGWPEDGPTLDLDHEQFAYAGKFVMSSTGKAVARDDGIVAAVAFNADRTDDTTLWLRYVTVRQDRRGEGIAPRLVRFVLGRARDRDYETVKIAVNNPFAYEACYRAGFGFTGERTGIAELVLASPGDRSPDRYQEGLAAFRERDLSPAEETFLADRTDADPPDVIESGDAP
ncbi:MAG: GNAT family N-acetyltransferase [Haloarculaceae archaeon]